jgi:predicted anti-sigma-YlaC factor YlaD
MTCERWQDAISARLDGEDLGVDAALLDAHLRRCPACRRFAEQAAVIHAPMRVAAADDVPDLSRRVRKAAALADRAGAWGIARGLLVLVALQIIVFSIPDLLFGDEAETSTHAARHLGAFTVAYGMALLVVAVRPARARAVLPVAAVLAGALVITAVIDLVEGRIPLLGEAQHLPELLSVLLVWSLAAPARRPRRRQAARPVAPRLRVVDEERRDTG